MTTESNFDASVLVVDDDAASARLALAILRTEGCAARAAASAEEANEMLASFRPRVIVLDLILPLMSGLTFAQQLKANPATRDIVLIATTVLSGADTERTAQQAGFAAYLRKPLDASSFAQLVLRHVKGTS